MTLSLVVAMVYAFAAESGGAQSVLGWLILAAGILGWVVAIVLGLFWWSAENDLDQHRIALRLAQRLNAWLRNTPGGDQQRKRLAGLGGLNADGANTDRSAPAKPAISPNIMRRWPVHTTLLDEAPEPTIYEFAPEVAPN